MIRFVITFLFVLPGFLASANKDSLEAVFKNTSLADTTRWRAAERWVTVSVKKDPEGSAAFIDSWALQIPSKDIYWSAKIRVMKGFVELVKRRDLQAAAGLYNEAARLFLSGGFKNDAAKAYYKAGDCDFIRSGFLPAMEAYRKSIKLYEELKNEKEQMPAISMVGNIFFYLSDYPKAIENYQAVLKIAERLKDDNGIAMAYSNMANVYGASEDYKKSLEINLECLAMRERIKDTVGIIACYGNIGSCYGGLKEWDKALEYQEKRLVLIGPNGSINLIADTYNSIGIIYSNMKKFDQALDYLKKALELSIKTNHDMDITLNYQNTANLYYDRKDYARSLELAVISERMARKSGYRNEEKDASLIHSKAAEAMGKATEALKAYKRYIELRDSIFSEENGEAIARKEIQYEFDKKAATDSISNLEEKKITQAQLMTQSTQIKHEKTLRFGLYGGICLILIFSLFMYNRFKVTRRQKEVIEFQKAIVEEKQKEILDSIHYAKRIQTALIPNDKFIQKTMDRMRGKRGTG